MSYTYILKLNSDKFTYYIGSCNNLEERLKRHNQGRAKYTKPYRPVKHEKYLKSLKSKRKIEELVTKNSNDAAFV